METYANNNGNSSVAAYQLGNDFILVEFLANKYSNTMYYRYTYASAGQGPIEEMKRLAVYGSGLSSYINTNKVPYATKGSTLGSV